MNGLGMDKTATSIQTLVPSWIPKIDLVTVSQPWVSWCQIDCRNDLEAVQVWLDQYKTQPTTYKAYQKEVERFILWCIYERGSTIGELKVADFNEYFKFLNSPPNSWRTSRAGLRQGRGKGDWRPFLGSLTRSSLLFAVKVINSLMNYLVAADYVRTNPIKLIKNYQELEFNQDDAKYQVWQRMLEADEWVAIQRALENLPEADKKTIHYKLRAQFLFMLLYLLGLRIHEVAKHGWNAFRQMDEQWWFFVQGKGNKLGHIPVNQQLLSMVKIYRIHLNKLPLPTIDETDQLFISKKTKRPLGIRQLYEIVKAIGQIAAQEFKDDLNKKSKLESLSPHWLRHLSASHQDQAGISGTIIQANHRHGSFSTTRIYLHAEDKIRSNEMEKLKMQLQPRSISLKQDINDKVTVNLELIGGSLSETLGLQRLMASIENQVLSGINWSKNEEKEALIAKHQQIKAFGIPLKFSYLLTANLTAIKLVQLERAIIRKAEIRLFKCTINIKQLGKAND